MIDISKKAKRSTADWDKVFTSIPTLAEYLKTGKSEVLYRANPIVLSREFDNDAAVMYVDGNGVLRGNTSLEGARYQASHLGRVSLDEAMRYELILSEHNGKRLLFEDGGALNVGGGPNVHVDSPQTLTISFACLGRFFSRSDKASTLVLAGRKAITTGQVKLVDFWPDHWITASAAARKKNRVARTRVTLTPPKPGYTMASHLVGSCYKDDWHRPATALFNITGSNNSIVTGMDEGSYFGCELAGQFNTVKDAFLALAPVEAVGSGKLLPGVMRQGEWFAIPVGTVRNPPGDLPEAHRSIARPERIDRDPGGLALPKEHANSADHVVIGDVRITAFGRWYVRDFIVEHTTGEHVDMRPTNANTWYLLKCNNAIRSFSEQGVD